MVFFRVDGNSTIGTGHIMRCLTLATAFKKLGEECVFVTSDNALSTVISDNGFEDIILNSDWQQLERELPIFIPVINAKKPDKIIVDSYFVTHKYLSCVTDKAYCIYIDDLAAFKYPVDAIINYNIYADMYDYSYCNTTYLGTAHCLLRDEFSNILPIVRKSVKNILISTGGSDPINLGYKLLKQFSNMPLFKDIKLHIIVGGLNPYAEQILSLAQDNKNIVVHTQIKNMAALMQGCDIAVSASGSTLYELCSLGIPTVNYTFADNQLIGALSFSDKGIMLYCGDAREGVQDCLDKISKNVASLFDYGLRLSYSKKMSLLVSQNSALQLAKEIVTHPA